MARIDSAYDYYVTNYQSREVSRYDSHKKSDLRKVYNSIVKTNTESPLYKIKNVDEAKKYAIDIKENAKSIQNVVAALSDKYGDFEDSFRKKVAVSSNEEEVGVTYVGDGTEENEAEAFTLQVQKLAKPQVNTGNFLADDALSFTPGTYNFDLATNTTTYEFQFNVSQGETNLDILTKLSNLVNTSNLGVTSQLLTSGEGSTAMELTSVQTGLSDQEDYLFNITPSATNSSISAMNLLGIDQVTEEASNSSFLLNNEEKASLSNTFTINNAFEITLREPGNTPVQVSFKTDTESAADNIENLLDVYNKILDTATSRDTNSSKSVANTKLYNDISNISKRQASSLEEIGIMVEDDGHTSLDRGIFEEAMQEDRAPETIETLNKFKDAIGAKANDAAINPMNYVNKVVVAYKNPGHNFTTPYITSIYSGLMLDSYV